MKALNLFLILTISLVLLSFLVKSVNVSLLSLSPVKKIETMDYSHNHLLNQDDKDKLHKASIIKADYEMGGYEQKTNHSCYMYKDMVGALPSDMNLPTHHRLT